MKGKYRNSAEAAAERNAAISTAAERAEAARRLETENVRLRARVDELEHDNARIVAARVAELTAKIDTLDAERAVERLALKRAGESIVSLFHYVVDTRKGLVGLARAVCDAEVAAGGFVVKGEYVPVGVAMLELDDHTGHLLAVRKLPPQDRDRPGNEKVRRARQVQQNKATAADYYGRVAG